MQARFRADYAGEFVIIDSIWAQGKKKQTREWVANPIENHHISGRAAVIGSHHSLQDPYPRGIDYTILQRHRGGLLGTLKLQNYGTGEIAQNMRLDFAVELDPTRLKTLIESKYYENNVVYTSARNCIAYPGDFYLIPHNPRLLLPVLPVYLAAFDGHQEIFLIGYNNELDFGNRQWISDMLEIITAYSATKFWCIGESTIMPETWLECANVGTMSYRDFVGYADV